MRVGAQEVVRAGGQGAGLHLGGVGFVGVKGGSQTLSGLFTLTIVTGKK